MNLLYYKQTWGEKAPSVILSQTFSNPNKLVSLYFVVQKFGKK